MTKQIIDFITRKSMLYKSKVSYGGHSLNFVLGCAHGCKFPCYAQKRKEEYKEVRDYDDWCQPKLVSNTLELLDQEIPKMKHEIKYVNLCFMTDCFMYDYPEVTDMALKVIRKLNAAGIRCDTLTKGISPVKELLELSKDNTYGITVVSLDEDYRLSMEPGAAPIKDRIAALKELHDRGAKTWVSMEPWPPEKILKQDINQVLESIGFVDRIVFGRTNYDDVVEEDEAVNAIYYDKCARAVIKFCKERHIEVIIKENTLFEEYGDFTHVFDFELEGNIAKDKLDQRVNLIHEADNVADANAVAVCMDGKKIGYAAKMLSKAVANLVDSGKPIMATVSGFNKGKARIRIDKMIPLEYLACVKANHEKAKEQFAALKF